jgi:hypothetical protein
MRVDTQKPYTLAELKPKLEAAFPNYTIKFRGPKVLIIAEGKIAGAQIVGEKKNHVRIFEGFPTMGGQMLFVFTILLLGIIIPFGIYLISMKPKQVAVRDKVAAFVRQEYGTALASDNTDLLDDKI